MKEQRILLSQDGPHSNIIKFKPPMCFSRDDVNSVIRKLDVIFSDIESGKADLSTWKSTSNCVDLKIPTNGHDREGEGEPSPKRAKMVGGGINTSCVTLGDKAGRNGHSDTEIL